MEPRIRGTRKACNRFAILAAFLLILPTGATALDVTLQQVAGGYNGPIGIDYLQTSGSLVVSTNYNVGGQPYVFEKLAFDGTRTPYTTAAGFTDEIKIAAVRSGNPNFATGTLFTGTGAAGQIAKIDPGGILTTNWTNTGTPGIFRGALYVDRTGLWNNNLIAVDTFGYISRINSAGTVTWQGYLGYNVEGLLTLPNDPTRWGSLAGNILLGSHDAQAVWALAPDLTMRYYFLGSFIEDLDLIAPGENFYGVDYGNNRVLTISAAELAPIAGDILLTEEIRVGSPTMMSRLFWDGTTLRTEAIGLTFSSQVPTQWEQSTFAPVPEPGTMMLLGSGLAGLAAWRRKRS